MSKGRARHQSSRRRMYSARQRDLRERRLRAAREDYWLSDQVAAIEIEEGLRGAHQLRHLSASPRDRGLARGGSTRMAVIGARPAGPVVPRRPWACPPASSRSRGSPNPSRPGADRNVGRRPADPWRSSSPPLSRSSTSASRPAWPPAATRSTTSPQPWPSAVPSSSSWSRQWRTRVHRQRSPGARASGSASRTSTAPPSRSPHRQARRLTHPSAAERGR